MSEFVPDMEQRRKAMKGFNDLLIKLKKMKVHKCSKCGHKEIFREVNTLQNSHWIKGEE